MKMRRLSGHKAKIWDLTKNEETGVKGLVQASIAFDVTKPQCSRCANKNRRIVVLIEDKGCREARIGKNLRLCMDCLTDLVEGINAAMREFKLVRLVLTGLPIGDAIEEVLNGDEADASGAAELQAALDNMVDMMYAATGETEVKKQRRAREIENVFKDVEADL